VTADRASGQLRSQLDTWRAMRLTPIAAGVIALLVAIVAPGRLPLAFPMLVLWGFSPLLAYVTGQELALERRPLQRGDRDAYRKIARRTWRFFDDLIGAGDNWLMPDNLQEDRREPIAHRTSPTNIGLQLLSTLAAYDLRLRQRRRSAQPARAGVRHAAAHAALPRPLYNWYDTRTLALLPPAYISNRRQRQPRRLFPHAARRPGGRRRALADDRPGVSLGPARSRRSGAGGSRPRGPTLPAAARRRAGACGAIWCNCATRSTSAPENIADWNALLRPPEGPDIRRLPSCCTRSRSGSRRGRLNQEGSNAAMGEAGYWLDRAASAIVERQADLQRLAPVLEEIERHDGRGRPGRLAQPRGDRSPRPSRARRRHRTSTAARRSPMRCQIAEESVERMERLGALADDFVEETEFGFLFTPERQLFSIGFNVAEGRLDASYYDTLASEARLASFMAIATGKIAPEHWFKLGRSLTPAGRSRALLSWSASMFEYLMPLLVMRSYPGTLLEETLRRRHRPADAVRRAARRAVGRLRVGVLRAGSRGQLSIPCLRRAGASASNAASATISSSRPTRACWPRRSRRGKC
jgi:hypothetical protein